MRVLLISTYELGHQPFGLASPAAWLAEAGARVRCLDLAVQPLDESAVAEAELIGLYLPMHTATRLAAELIPRLRALAPEAHLCCFGLYAPVSEALLRDLGVHTLIGGEFEAELVALFERLATDHRPAHVEGVPAANAPTEQRTPKAFPPPMRQLTGQRRDVSDDESSSGVAGHSPVVSGPSSSVVGRRSSVVSMDRLDFRVPDRAALPPLEAYARLLMPDGTERVAGYTEASRGCKHLCRHCPIVPVYGGRFRVVRREIVLEDIRRQVAAGARHVTFGDPDFFNGPGHALPLVRALHAEFPELTYDVTIKVEHLLRHAEHLPELRATGCLFVTSAVEALDDAILTIFDKRHTRADFERAVGLLRGAGLTLNPTFVAFTPWTTRALYLEWLRAIRDLGLVENVAPVQYAIRLLVPAGSRLLELPEVRRIVGAFDQRALCYRWEHPDPAMDRLQAEVNRAVHRAQRAGEGREQIFERVWALASGAGEPEMTGWRHPPRMLIPHMSEPWYC
jgi:radical SAM superfamily enzyme YgiQ (UPF0313 family)